MKTKEQIARECIEINPESYFDPLKEFIPHVWVLNSMEKYAQQFNQNWISVDDELPQNLNLVLAYNEYKKGVCIASYFKDDNTWFSVNNEGKQVEYLVITHWMPLPEPPKSE